jgi:hypothetical protein
VLETGTELRGPVGAMAPLNSKEEEKKLGKKNYKEKKKLSMLAPTNKFFWPLAYGHKSFWLRP